MHKVALACFQQESMISLQHAVPTTIYNKSMHRLQKKGTSVGSWVFVQEYSPRTKHEKTLWKTISSFHVSNNDVDPEKPLPRTGDQGLGWNEVHLGGRVASHDTTTRALLSHRFSCATQKCTLHQWGDSGVMRFLVLRTKRIINVIGQQFGQWFFQVRPRCVEPPGQARVKRGAKVATWAVVFASLFSAFGCFSENLLRHC